MIKNSRQRALIVSVLKQHTDHPTAADLYEEIHQIDDHISLGTVYRNLNLLSETGEILKIEDGSNSAHYDAAVIPHYHHICKRCGAIRDIEVPYTRELADRIQKEIPHRIDSEQTVFYGLCEDCLKEMS